MDTNSPVGVDDVKDVLVETLGLEDRGDSLTADTRLFGALPELDSLAVVELIVALERRFGIEVPPEDVTAETFETLGALTEFIAGQVRQSA